jgi:hypothetical protein
MPLKNKFEEDMCTTDKQDICTVDLLCAVLLYSLQSESKLRA